MAALTVQTIVAAGLAPSYAAASAGGDTIANDSQKNTFLHVKNASGGAITVTIAPAQSSVNVADVGAVTVPSMVVSVPATTGDRMIGPFPAAYTDANGNVAVTYSAVTSLTVAAVKLPRAA